MQFISESFCVSGAVLFFYILAGRKGLFDNKIIENNFFICLARGSDRFFFATTFFIVKFVCLDLGAFLSFYTYLQLLTTFNQDSYKDYTNSNFFLFLSGM